MKKPKFPWVVLFLVTLLISSANPTNSQKKTDSLPPDVVPTITILRDSVEVIPVQKSRIDSVAKKAEQVEKLFDQVDEKSDKISKQLLRIQSRQVKILKSLSPAQREVIPVLVPKPPTVILSDPAQPEIKPVEVEKPSWWKRTFGHD